MVLLLKDLYVLKNLICTYIRILDTWVVFPWTAEKGKVARLICDIYNPDGTPFEGDPRNNLKRVLEEDGRIRIYKL